MAVTIWWEDMQPGTVRELGTATVTAEEIKEFARQYDPQPFHLEEEAGRRSLFGALCASGWQTCGLAMRLTVDNLLRHTDSKGSPGLESLKWLKPVYAGDTLTYRSQFIEARPSASRPGWGLVTHRNFAENQHGEPVYEFTGTAFWERRT